MNKLDLNHEHSFVVRNKENPEGDQCTCGLFRYEIMGPIHRKQAQRRFAIIQEYEAAERLRVGGKSR